MRAEHRPVESTIFPGAAPSCRDRKPWVSPSAMKQTSWLSGLSATKQAALRRLLADQRLGRVAEREHRVRDLVPGEHREDIRLVLAGINGPLQSAIRNVDPRVVPGADRVEAERQRPVEHRLELDLLVAAQARVGGPARRVLGDEVVHHVLPKPLGQVPDVERDADHVGGPARVPRVLERAAAARPGPVRLRIRRQRKMDAGHLMTGVDRARRRGGGVNPARHGGKNLKPHDHSRLPAADRPMAALTG